MADNQRQIMEATESFVAEVDGERYVVHRKLTRIAASHPLAQAHSDRFRPIEGHLSYEEAAQATAEPGSRAGVSRASGDRSVLSEPQSRPEPKAASSSSSGASQASGKTAAGKTAAATTASKED